VDGVERRRLFVGARVAADQVHAGMSQDPQHELGTDVAGRSDNCHAFDHRRHSNDPLHWGLQSG
jgi:hypothetical protein